MSTRDTTCLSNCLVNLHINFQWSLYKNSQNSVNVNHFHLSPVKNTKWVYFLPHKRGPLGLSGSTSQLTMLPSMMPSIIVFISFFLRNCFFFFLIELYWEIKTDCMHFIHTQLKYLILTASSSQIQLYLDFH